MPDRIRKFSRLSRMDQFLNYLGKHTKIVAPDLRPALLAAKKDYQVYPKKDTHWSEPGPSSPTAKSKKRSPLSSRPPPSGLVGFRIETGPGKERGYVRLAGADRVAHQRSGLGPGTRRPGLAIRLPGR